MSEPLTSRSWRVVYNSLLLASSGWAAWKLDTATQPFALAACAVGGVAGVFGLLRILFGPAGGNEWMPRRDSDGLNSKRELRMLRNISQGLLELMPLPLVNMELYAHSLGLGPLALGHGISVIPMLLDLNCSIIKRRKNCDLTETLRDLSMLGNIISLGFLAVMEQNFLYVRMTLTMLVIKFYPIIMDTAQEESGEDLVICCTAIFFYLFARVLDQWAVQ